MKPIVYGASKPDPFVVMVKPVGSACNMRCDYCYYLGAEGSSPAGVMSDAVLETLVREYIAASRGPVVSFTWHGGEPMLAGLNFYRRAVELQRKYLPEGWECWNNLQTNGLMLDDEWCEFLAYERFDVGISIDGTSAVHDAHRRDVRGEPTYERVCEAIARLKRHGIRPDLLCTVTRDTARHGADVYTALRELDTGWMQFIPVVVRDDTSPDKVTPYSVTPEAYGDFLCDVCAKWLFNDMGRVEVQLFSETALTLAGAEPNLCWLRRSCGNVPVIERDGGVFACDHYVRPNYRVGELGGQSLSEIMLSPTQLEFGSRKHERLTHECRQCPFLRLCNGGCPKDRFGRSADGEAGQYYLCAGLKRYFGYAVPRLSHAMQLSARRFSKQQIMKTLTVSERALRRSTAYDAPCPCGSGRKYGECCRGRQ